MRSGGWWVGIALALCSASGWAQVELLLIGTYTNTDAHSRGIYSALFDTKTGAITNLKVAAEAANPSFLARHPSRPFLYAVNEMPDGMVSSFAIRAGGELMLIGSTSTGGAAPCHLIVDRSGKWLLAANYNGGSIAVFPILADGSAGKATVIQHSGSGPSPRQKGPHPHEIVELGGNIILVPDLGADRVARYTFNAAEGRLSPADPPEMRLPAGSGPRHLAASADGKKLYVLIELANTVTVLVESTPVQTVPLLTDPGIRNTGAEIAMHPNGRYLYASNRGADNIVVFTVDATTGKLTRAGSAPTGAGPRFFMIDAGGKWLLAAGQASNTITVFAIDPANGLLHPQGKQFDVPSPVFMAASAGH